MTEQANKGKPNIAGSDAKSAAEQITKPCVMSSGLAELTLPAVTSIEASFPGRFRQRTRDLLRSTCRDDLVHARGERKH